MAKLKTPPKSSRPEEEQFKQEIQPAAWVNEYAAQRAKETYAEYRDAHGKIWRGEKKAPADIVPYLVRLRGIERLVTDPQLEAFWKKAAFDVIGSIAGLYDRYFGQANNMRLNVPSISKRQRDKRLDNIAKHLDRICREIDADSSVAVCFEAAFLDALQAGSFEVKNPCSIGAFLQKLQQSISTDGPSSCRHVKTHDALPRNIGEGGKSERGRFIYGISQIVFNSYRRTNHAVSAKILNVLRPDLGEFTADNVRQYMNKRPLAKWW
jgi:hypothetical protein